MVLDAVIGWNAKRYPESGEIVKVLVGRSYAVSGNTQPLAGNTVADNMNIGKSYNVPTGRKFTLYSYYMSWHANSLSQSDISSAIEKPFYPIGQGNTDASSNFAIVAHVDFSLTDIRVNPFNENRGDVYTEERGDCAVDFAAGMYPKIGTIGRNDMRYSPGGEGLYPADFMLWGIEGAA